MKANNSKKLYTTMESCLQDGMTRRSAEYYLSQLEADRKSNVYDQDYVKWAHMHGFFAESAYIYGLNECNVDEYLCDYCFWKAWPLNNWSRIWVNDKLTLKLMLSDKELTGFMPEYYYYSIDNVLKPLGDSNYNKEMFSGFIDKLKEKKEFACKPCNGSKANGFIHLSYEEGSFFINNIKTDELGLQEFAKTHSNYLFTEFIRPSTKFAKYSTIIHTLRIVVVNKSGYNPQIVGGYLRIPHNRAGDSNMVNLIAFDGNDEDQYNIYCDVDFKTGWYGNPSKCYCNKVESQREHPDTGEIMEGYIENFDKLRDIVFFIARKFSNLEYYGLDIGITDNGFKCMEINTQPGIQYMQVFHPINKNPVLKDYFEDKMNAIEVLNQNQIKKRNELKN